MQRTFAFERGTAWTGVRKAGNGLRLREGVTDSLNKMEGVDERSSQYRGALRRQRYPLCVTITEENRLVILEYPYLGTR
jgi:hypothetical protein